MPKKRPLALVGILAITVGVLAGSLFHLLAHLMDIRLGGHPATDIPALALIVALLAFALALELQPGECSFHDAWTIHGSNANHSEKRRTGYTMRYMPANVVLKREGWNKAHQIYLLRGQDQTGGKSFADNFLTTNPKVDVLFQVAGLTGNGVLDSACAKGIYGIGVDVDQFLSYPNADKCLVTSAEKHISVAVKTAITNAVKKTWPTSGVLLFDAKNQGVGISAFHNFDSQVPADAKTMVTDAAKKLADGSLQTGYTG